MSYSSSVTLCMHTDTYACRGCTYMYSNAINEWLHIFRDMMFDFKCVCVKIGLQSFKIPFLYILKMPPCACCVSQWKTLWNSDDKETAMLPHRFDCFTEKLSKCRNTVLKIGYLMGITANLSSIFCDILALFHLSRLLKCRYSLLAPHQ